MTVISRLTFLGERGIGMLEQSIRLRPYINLMKRIGYGKIVLFLLLTQPTNGRHWQYYGWIARLIGLGSLAFLTSLATINYPFQALCVFLGLCAYRWYQRVAELKRRKAAGINVVTLTDLRKRIVRDLPCPVVERELITRDNVRLRYQTIGTGKELIFLANGIGGTIYHFDPLLNQLAKRKLYDKFTVVSWDFRGLFQSGYPAHAAAMSVRDHAEDVMELCKALERDTIHTIVGWSTGVQIALELSCMYPERIGRMVLLNGSYGRTLQYCFQPILRIPWFGDVIHDLINFVRLNMVDYYKSVANFLVRHRKWLMRGMRPYGLLYNQVDCEKFLGFYVIDILNNSRNHTDSYLRALQFLDAHSSEHLLHEIETPTLIETGMLDYLTPAYLSFEMYRQMPNSKIICHNFCTHFALLEKPEKIGMELADFICNDDDIKYSKWYQNYVNSDEHNKPTSMHNREQYKRDFNSPRVSPRNSRKNSENITLRDTTPKQDGNADHMHSTTMKSTDTQHVESQQSTAHASGH